MNDTCSNEKKHEKEFDRFGSNVDGDIVPHKLYQGDSDRS